MKSTRVFLVTMAFLAYSLSGAMAFKEGDKVCLVGGPFGQESVKAEIKSAYQELFGGQSFEQMKMHPLFSRYLDAHGHDKSLLDPKRVYLVTIKGAYHLVHDSWIKSVGTVASAAAPAQKVASKK